MADQAPPQEPPEYREFDELYHKVIRTDWHHPQLKEHVKALEAFLANHRELYSNKYFAPCIRAARDHCKAAGIPHTF